MFGIRLTAHHLGPRISDCLPRGRGHGAASSQLGAIAGPLRYRILFGQSFPRWRGSFFVGSLKHRDLFRITVDGDRETLRETVLHDVHRMRDIATDRDGLVYVLTDSGDLLRLVPTR